MIDALAWIDKLSTFTLGGLVSIVLVLGYFKKWRYGSEYDEMKADLTARAVKAEQMSERWMTAALGATSLAELMKPPR